AQGIPVFPVVAMTYIPYCAFPIVSGDPGLWAYTPTEILTSAATVSLFLVVAAVAWHSLSRRPQVASSVRLGDGEGVTAVRLAFGGLVIGVIYQLNIVSQSVDWGSYLGLARSVALTFATVGCLLIGVTRA